MTIYSIPQNLKTIIFDIDSTLYTHPFYAHEQVDIQIRSFAKLRSISDEEARKQVNDYRSNYANQHHGKKISLGNTLKAFGISIEQSISWRNELLEPSQFLQADKRLAQEILLLKESFSLICLTNNPILPARKTLKALGISDLIENLIGLDTCGVSKPHEKPFLLAAQTTNSDIQDCISIGDRYDIDIDLPLKLGMGGILVNGVKEIYNLHRILKKKQK